MIVDAQAMGTFVVILGFATLRSPTGVPSWSTLPENHKTGRGYRGRDPLAKAV